ncbi:MAG: sialate O-acetylesterase, partial [Verrucomicrobiota bacterium]|nr:sialate O-acetylesterase [Verrucomicrobiota bacterium]
MKLLLKLKYLPLLVSLVCSSFSAELRFAKIFTDHAVLQRDISVPVWGWAEPEVEVTVEFSSQKKRSSTDKTGNWMIRLDAMVANPNGQQLKATAVGSSF